ncbi:MAG: hypothetical protein ACC654_02765, partial [Acidimicrobiia bacterium]
MKYRLLTLLAVIALVAAACASSGDDEATTTTAGDTGGGGEAAEVIDIDFWVAFSDEKRLGFAEDRAAEFNANHPEYNIKVT